MENLPDQHDLIVARSTPPGAGAIAIVRVDGRRTADLIRALFRPAGQAHPVEAPRTAIFGGWLDPETAEPIDSGLTLYFPHAHSFTGNELAELYCHGSPAVVRRLIRACSALGARPAQAGEFTRRAFLNGRLDLAQAEAVADLIAAETDASARAALGQLAGGLSREVRSLREVLITLAAEIEARIDFPDEGIEPADLDRLNSYFTALQQELKKLLGSERRGRLLREGARVAFVGPPNVGKSSLLNALTRSDRAIVTPHPGTTRDTIEAVIDLGGIPVTLIDTAGLRSSDEPIERIGIERTLRAVEEADIIVEVRDATGSIPPLGSESLSNRSPHFILENKADLMADDPSHPAGGSTPILRVSALLGVGIEELEARLFALLTGDQAVGVEPFAINERHLALLRQSLAHLDEARAGWDVQTGSELVMIDLRESLAALDAILGLGPHEAILDQVFSRFCIGK